MKFLLILLFANQFLFAQNDPPPASSRIPLTLAPTPIELPLVPPNPEVKKVSPPAEEKPVSEDIQRNRARALKVERELDIIEAKLRANFYGVDGYINRIMAVLRDKYSYIQVDNKPRTMPFIVWLAPQGSGKTSIGDALIQYIMEADFPDDFAKPQKFYKKIGSRKVRDAKDKDGVDEKEDIVKVPSILNDLASANILDLDSVGVERKKGLKAIYFIDEFGKLKTMQARFEEMQASKANSGIVASNSKLSPEEELFKEVESYGIEIEIVKRELETHMQSSYDKVLDRIPWVNLYRDYRKEKQDEIDRKNREILLEHAKLDAEKAIELRKEEERKKEEAKKEGQSESTKSGGIILQGGTNNQKPVYFEMPKELIAPHNLNPRDAMQLLPADIRKKHADEAMEKERMTYLHDVVGDLRNDHAAQAHAEREFVQFLTEGLGEGKVTKPGANIMVHLRQFRGNREKLGTKDLNIEFLKNTVLTVERDHLLEEAKHLYGKHTNLKNELAGLMRDFEATQSSKLKTTNKAKSFLLRKNEPGFALPDDSHKAPAASRFWMLIQEGNPQLFTDYEGHINEERALRAKINEKEGEIAKLKIPNRTLAELKRSAYKSELDEFLRAALDKSVTAEYFKTIAAIEALEKEKSDALENFLKEKFIEEFVKSFPDLFKEYIREFKEVDLGGNGNTRYKALLDKAELLEAIKFVYKNNPDKLLDYIQSKESKYQVNAQLYLVDNVLLIAQGNADQYEAQVETKAKERKKEFDPDAFRDAEIEIAKIPRTTLDHVTDFFVGIFGRGVDWRRLASRLRLDNVHWGVSPKGFYFRDREEWKEFVREAVKKQIEYASHDSGKRLDLKLNIEIDPSIIEVIFRRSSGENRGRSIHDDMSMIVRPIVARVTRIQLERLEKGESEVSSIRVSYDGDLKKILGKNELEDSKLAEVFSYDIQVMNAPPAKISSQDNSRDIFYAKRMAAETLFVTRYIKSTRRAFNIEGFDVSDPIRALEPGWDRPTETLPLFLRTVIIGILARLASDKLFIHPFNETKVDMEHAVALMHILIDTLKNDFKEARFSTDETKKVKLGIDIDYASFKNSLLLSVVFEEMLREKSADGKSGPIHEMEDKSYRDRVIREILDTTRDEMITILRGDYAKPQAEIEKFILDNRVYTATELPEGASLDGYKDIDPIAKILERANPSLPDNLKFQIFGAPGSFTHSCLMLTDILRQQVVQPNMVAKAAAATRSRWDKIYNSKVVLALRYIGRNVVFWRSPKMVRPSAHVNTAAVPPMSPP